MKKIITRLLIIPLFMSFVITANAQYQANANPSGIITGKVNDEGTKKAVEYANIVLYKAQDSSLVTGTISGADGSFLLENVPSGKYYIVANFIGYEKYTTDNITISNNKKNINVPPISLKQALTEIEQAEIVGNKNYVEYKIDKKIVNVSQHVNAAGGTASDVLENVPSVDVDLDGNVTLRGSSNFTVLIDGRPSIIEGSDALTQLPASAIQNIEIITNPSAKYDPDGTAGIINVIMKKQKLRGTSGIINLSAGTSPDYSGDILLNYRTGKFNFSGGLSYSDRNMQRYSESFREYLTDTVYYLEENSDGTMNRGGYNFKGGVDYDITDNNKIFATGTYRSFSFGNSTIDNQREWDEVGSYNDYYVSDNGSEMTMDGLSINLGDNHKFNDKGHEIRFNTTVTKTLFDRNVTSLTQYITDASFIPGNEINTQTENINESDGYDFRADLDYTWPFSEKGTIEAGYQLRSENETSDITYQEMNQVTGLWEIDNNTSNSYEYERNIHALYFTYANQFSFVDVKFGLRTEYTDRSLDQNTLNNKFTYESLDFYPSAYITKRFSNDQQIQLNYSRRVNRPRGQSMNPFTIRSDGYTAFKGNPEIEPEFANSYELNYQKYFGRSSVSVESYFRQTVNKMTRITTVTDEGLYEMSMTNLDEDYSLGVEFSGNLQLTKWWMFMPSGTIYKYHLEGNAESASVAKNSNNWRFRANTSFTLPTKTRLDIFAMYNSPTVTVDGEREAFLMTGLGVRHDFLDKKLTLTLRARDLFGTAHRKSTYISASSLSTSDSWGKSPIFSISLSYKINNYRTGRNNNSSGGDNGGMDTESSDFEMMM